MKLEKAKTFVKEHKKELAIGAGCLVIGGAIFFITKKKPKILDEGLAACVHLPKLTKLDVPDSLKAKGVYEISSHNPDKYLDIWLDNVSLSKLGEVGEELIAACGCASDTTISGVVDVGMTIENITEF